MRALQRLICGMALSVAALAGSAARAGFVTVDGTLADTGTGFSIDYYAVDIAIPRFVTFDIRSWEINDSATPVDLNGDGEIAFIDSYIFLFKNDGSLDAADLLAENDDNPFAPPVGYGDGSLSFFDSYLALNLAAGNYLLAVAAAPVSLDDVVAMLDPVSGKGIVYQLDGTFVGSDHGDYRLSVTDSDPLVAAVPEPSSLVTFGMCALCASLSGIRARCKREMRQG